ncbi:hypothetical protein HZB03_01945 [Candidatus Woesearchaeota archaeon]|nr:hypothetical protein [Candidatus Woesearchaeota archaeon]
MSKTLTHDDEGFVFSETHGLYLLPSTITEDEPRQAQEHKQFTTINSHILERLLSETGADAHLDPDALKVLQQLNNPLRPKQSSQPHHLPKPDPLDTPTLPRMQDSLHDSITTPCHTSSAMDDTMHPALADGLLTHHAIDKRLEDIEPPFFAQKPTLVHDPITPPRTPFTEDITPHQSLPDHLNDTRFPELQEPLAARELLDDLDPSAVRDQLQQCEFSTIDDLNPIMSARRNRYDLDSELPLPKPFTSQIALQHDIDLPEPEAQPQIRITTPHHPLQSSPFDAPFTNLTTTIEPMRRHTFSIGDTPSKMTMKLPRSQQPLLDEIYPLDPLQDKTSFRAPYGKYGRLADPDYFEQFPPRVRSTTYEDNFSMQHIPEPPHSPFNDDRDADLNIISELLPDPLLNPDPELLTPWYALDPTMQAQIPPLLEKWNSLDDKPGVCGFAMDNGLMLDPLATDFITPPSGHKWSQAFDNPALDHYRYPKVFPTLFDDQNTRTSRPYKKFEDQTLDKPIKFHRAPEIEPPFLTSRHSTFETITNDYEFNTHIRRTRLHDDFTDNTPPLKYNPKIFQIHDPIQPPELHEPNDFKTPLHHQPTTPQTIEPFTYIDKHAPHIPPIDPPLDAFQGDLPPQLPELPLIPEPKIKPAQSSHEFIPIHLQEKTFLERKLEAEIEQETLQQKLQRHAPMPDLSPLNPLLEPKTMNPRIADLDQPQTSHLPEQTLAQSIDDFTHDPMQDTTPTSTKHEMPSFYDQELIYSNPTLEQQLIDTAEPFSPQSTSPFAQQFHRTSIDGIATAPTTYQQEIDDSLIQDLYRAAQENAGPERCSLQTAQPFQMAYDLPETGTQLHLHGPDRTTITEGRIYSYDRKVLQDKIGGYDASMAALGAEQLGFKKIIP